MKVLTVIGTRPEVIKLAPVVQKLLRVSGVQHVLCSTGQHREMLDQVVSAFDLAPDIDLNVMVPSQDIRHVTSAVLEGITTVLRDLRPDWVLVQGDTTTCFAAALGAFYERTRIAHVEAGLRTGNLASPWPEEANRRLVSVLTDRHYAPTEAARSNLLAEGTPSARILVTGNTVIDALIYTLERIRTTPGLSADLERSFDFLDDDRRLILVTGHRRENLDGGILEICRALARLAERSDVQIVFPVHLNPKVQSTVRQALADKRNVVLMKPLKYVPFVHLMSKAHVIITDSGGIQEEAPALGKPVLVARDTTERPEAVTAGTARLVGATCEAIVRATEELLDDAAAYRRMSGAKNPFGDGRAADRICADLLACSMS